MCEGLIRDDWGSWFSLNHPYITGGPDDVIPDDDTLSQPGARTFHCLCC